MVAQGGRKLRAASQPGASPRAPRPAPRPRTAPAPAGRRLSSSARCDANTRALHEQTRTLKRSNAPRLLFFYSVPVTERETSP